MRKAEIKRKTKETNISISLNLDGSGKTSIETGIPFFDHMLSSFAKHSNIDLNLDTMGDLEVDFHHTIEDTGIVLGKAIKDALGDKKGISRFADATIPLDEALTRIVIDISGRAYLYFNVKFNRTDDGSNVNPYLFEEFFRGLVNSAEITMHIDTIRGNNSHHIIESIFKAFAKAFEGAIKITGKKLPTTKGVL
ncbi:MAG: imidazoleglycerol-phosphate dehydratase HisB [Spirochaetes bacterium]|nr:imidazoleglycerol-phosphate dehydratase HisB [Spirochaetota bacterium]